MDDGTTTIKATTEFLYNKLLTLEEQNETLLDRLDTIDMNIDRIEKGYTKDEVDKIVGFLLNTLEEFSKVEEHSYDYETKTWCESLNANGEYIECYTIDEIIEEILKDS
jgi:hypothetical protein